MASPADRVIWQDILIFWVKVLVICVILGSISFYVGRKYVGTMIAGPDIREGAPEITLQVTGENGEEDEVDKDAPAKVEVKVQEREGSETEIDNASHMLGHEKDDAAAEGDTEAIKDRDGTAERTETSSPSEREADSAAAGSSDGDQDDANYVVTAGSFLNAENSDQMLKELQEKGYKPYISKVTIKGKTYRRVNVGAFAGRDEADNLVRELRNAGYEAQVGVR
jgi:cell division septation protein DedD